MEKCEICGEEIESKGINPYTLFGQKVCSNECLAIRAERDVPEALREAASRKMELKDAKEMIRKANAGEMPSRQIPADLEGMIVTSLGDDFYLGGFGSDAEEVVIGPSDGGHRTVAWITEEAVPPVTVKSVDMFGGPMGGYGFRSGIWTATLSDGRKMKFYGSIPHQDGLNEERMIVSAQSALDHGTHKGIE